MNERLRQLLAQRSDALRDARAMVDSLQGPAVFSAEQQTQYDGLLARVASLNQGIEREEQLAAEERRAAAGAAAHVQALPAPQITGGVPASVQDPRAGFANFGEYAIAVRNAALQPHRIDQRLLPLGAAPTTYGNESTGADGGFLVPQEFSEQVRMHMLGVDNFLSMTDDIPVTGNSMAFPADETTPWGSDGVRAYWENEAAAATATKPKVGLRQLRLKKLFALVPVTDELLADARALSAYLPTKAGESIRYKANDSLINGDGAGKPLGILNAAALVTVTKESGQAAATLVAGNVSKMYSRMPPVSLGNAAWCIHHEVFPQLATMSISNQPVWHQDFARAPGGVLLGRPVFISQSCQVLGTKGDIYFVDWKKYVTIRKELEQATSMHFYFDSGHTAFRAIFRIDGQPWLDASITPARGSANQSPFVTLETRS